MLHAKADRRERVLDLVRHLTRHLTPREHPLRMRELRDVVERERGATARQPRELPSQRSAVALHVERVLGDVAAQEPGEPRGDRWRGHAAHWLAGARDVTKQRFGARVGEDAPPM